MKIPVSIRRGDGFGYQLAARLISIVVCNKLGIEYSHEKIPFARMHISSQDCIDFLYKRITGNENVTESSNVDYHSNWPSILKKYHPAEKISIQFTRDHFSQFANYFITNNAEIFAFDKEKYNVVMHVRRGDVASKEYGRCISDDDYIESGKNIVSPDSRPVQIHIETDSPHDINKISSALSAEVNTISKHTQDHLNSNPDSEWRKCFCILQSLYNMASADLFLPSRSSFSVLGAIIGRCDIKSSRVKIGWKKPVDKIWPVELRELNIDKPCEVLKFDTHWIHYLPIIDIKSANIYK